MNVPNPTVFENLTLDCKPISAKSRYSLSDKRFIELETAKLLENDIIEPSISSWRSQVLVTSNEHHKKRMVIDYSQTINKYTELDAYPLPRIDEMVNEIAQYKIFSTLDLKSANHQIYLKETGRKYTAFEACGRI